MMSMLLFNLEACSYSSSNSTCCAKPLPPHTAGLIPVNAIMNAKRSCGVVVLGDGDLDGDTGFFAHLNLLTGGSKTQRSPDRPDVVIAPDQVLQEGGKPRMAGPKLASAWAEAAGHEMEMKG